MWLDLMAKRYHQRPSQLLSIENDTDAFLFDALVAFLAHEESKPKNNPPGLISKLPEGININDFDYMLDPNARPNKVDLLNLQLLKNKHKIRGQ